jgi:hypothetical protein
MTSSSQSFGGFGRVEVIAIFVDVSAVMTASRMARRG